MAQLALFDVPPVPRHPARYTAHLIPHLAEALRGCRSVLDPMAGVGGIARVAALAGVSQVVGVELEPEWAGAHPCVIEGNALALPFPDDTFDAVCVSPTYGNRMADHHEARDRSVRHTYRHALGRPLHPDNSGALPWGPAYRDFHHRAWSEALRVLRPGGRFVVNCKDHIAAGELVPVTGWHVDTLAGLGCVLRARWTVDTPGHRHGANGHARVRFEHVAVFTAGAPMTDVVHEDDYPAADANLRPLIEEHMR